MSRRSPSLVSTTNPWVTRSTRAPRDEPQEQTPDPLPALTGPDTPQHGVATPDETAMLPIAARPVPGVPLWVLGAHGGSGESTLADLDDRWRAAGHWWPAPCPQASPTVLVTRTSSQGLMRARAVLTQWASRTVPHIELLGLVLMADAPGRLPRPLRDLSKLVAGGAPRTWSLPWVEAWRLGQAPALDDLPRQVRRLVKDLVSLTAPR